MYRASSLGYCTKRLIAERFGYEPAPTPSKMQEVFARGNEIEDIVLKRLDVWEPSHFQEEVVLPITEEITVIGHIDAIIQGRVLEIKSMDSSSFDRWVERGWDAGGLIDRYKWQVSAYMLATGRELILWGERNDCENFHKLTVETPFYNLNEIRMRVLLIEAAARNGDIPIECDGRMYPCPFFYLHDDETEYEDDEEIEGLGRAYEAARKGEQRAKRTVTGLRERLSNALGSREKVDTGTVRVSRYSTNRRSLDRESIERDGIDLSKYERTTTTSSIRVTVREDDASQGRSGEGADSADGSVGSRQE